MIIRDFPLLVKDLARVATKTSPIVLIKSSVCQLLESRLLNEGYNVINGGGVIYFPSHGRQRQFAQQFSYPQGCRDLIACTTGN